MSEFTQNVKALITSKGGTATPGDGLQASDIKQYAEIAQLYYGVTATTALMGLAYPESLPANLSDAISAGSGEGGEDAPEGEGDAAPMAAMSAPDGDEDFGGDDTSGVPSSADPVDDSTVDTTEDTTEDTTVNTEADDTTTSDEDPAAAEGADSEVAPE